MNHTGSGRFAYQTLPPASIRILTVRASLSLDTPLACTIRIVPRNKDAGYTALSYCWANEDGDASLCRELRIQGQPVAITRNLFEALRRLRRPGEDLHIWIDAICINQNDNNERTEQVSHMTAVYNSAHRVVAWLGEGDEDEDADMLTLLLDTINDIEGEMNSGLDDSFLALSWEDWLDRLHRVRVHDLKNWVPPSRAWKPSSRHTLDSTVNAVEAFLSRRYFTRRWIVQEIAHASHETIELHWGSRSLSGLRTFYAAQSVLIRSLQRLYQDSMNPDALRERCVSMCDTAMAFEAIIRTVMEPLPTLSRFLSTCNDLRCSDPRDIVYSLVSMDPGCGIIPDYGLDTIGVYTRTAEYMWCSGRADDVCNNLKYRDSLNTGLPSWALDLREGFYRTGHTYEFLQARAQAMQARAQVMQPSVDEDSILSCHLTYLGTVCPRKAQGHCFQIQHKDTGSKAKIDISGYMPDLEAMIMPDDILFTLPGPRLELPPYHKVLLLRKVSGGHFTQDSNSFTLERILRAKFDVAKVEGLGGFTDEWESDVKSPEFQQRMDGLVANLSDRRWPRPDVAVRIK